MFITTPTNIDYLIPSVRMRVGDIDGTRFTEAVVRSSILQAILHYQTKWSNRYYIYSSGYSILPSGYTYNAAETDKILIPSGYVPFVTKKQVFIIPSGVYREGDVFVSPTSSYKKSDGLLQEDEHLVVLYAAYILLTSFVAGNSSSFISWTDGEFSISTVQFSKLYSDILSKLREEMNEYEKKLAKSKFEPVL